MSGEFNGIILLGVFWFLLSLITRGSRKPRAPQPRSPVRPQPSTDGWQGMGDATQREGLRLEQVLRELQRSLETAAQPTVPARLPLPREQEVRSSPSLEVDPEVRSLEDLVPREARRPVDLDDEAADIEIRRIQAAASRDAPRTRQAQPSALQAVQQQPAEHTAGRAYTAQQLRDAVVWREILDPPVSLRGE